MRTARGAEAHPGPWLLPSGEGKGAGVPPSSTRRGIQNRPPSSLGAGFALDTGVAGGISILAN